MILLYVYIYVVIIWNDDKLFVLYVLCKNLYVRG